MHFYCSYELLFCFFELFRTVIISFAIIEQRTERIIPAAEPITVSSCPMRTVKNVNSAHITAFTAFGTAIRRNTANDKKP